MDFWETDAIISGYSSRLCQQWSSVRWLAYHLMSATAGTEALSDAGINSPADLLSLPTDKTNEEQKPPMTSEDVNELRRKIKEYNEKNGFT